MNRSALLTSFTTWQPHHVTNSSDDLLVELAGLAFGSLHMLRRIPVDFQLAPRHVLEQFNKLKPEVLICCGMAEDRDKLSIESRAVLDEDVLHTELDLKTLTRDLKMTEISDDAGGFVCNTLYFRALSHLRNLHTDHHCLFVHVPVLTENNIKGIMSDFLSVLQRLSIIDNTVLQTGY